MVGNKSDCSNRRIILESDGEALAEQNNLEFFEVSASTGKNVTELFVKMADLICKEKEAAKLSRSLDEETVQVKPRKKKKKKLCFI